MQAANLKILLSKTKNMQIIRNCLFILEEDSDYHFHLFETSLAVTKDRCKILSIKTSMLILFLKISLKFKVIRLFNVAWLD